MNKKSLFWIAGVTIGLLLIPLIAMQFTSEVNWSLSDFVIMGVMIFVTGTMINLTRLKMSKYKIAGVLTILVLFLWLWAELAVGVFTNWGS